MPAPIRVMSFNVRYGDAPDGADAWKNRRELLFKTIEDFHPDLLGTQEALAYQTDELRARLRGYSFAGAGRDDGKRNGEFSAVFFRAERFQEIDHGNFWLSESPDVPGKKGWDAAFPRMVSWVKLRDRASSGQLLFLNTHFDHQGTIARKESAKLVLRWLKEVSRGEAVPVIFSGDFNSTDDQPAIQEIERAGLSDSFRAVHPIRAENEATYHAFKGTRAGSRIDFIFHSREFHAASAAIDRASREGRYPSDHFPVTATLEWIELRD